MRRLVRAAAIGAASAGAAIGIERTFIAAPRYRGAPSDHFDGRKFHNLEAGMQRDGSFLKWMLTRERGEWPEWIDAPPGPPPPARAGDGRMRVTFINHATLLIQVDDLNILTDPIWSERTSPLPLVGPKRHRPPGIRFDDLPPIDVVLVSHNHYDHLDVPTLRRLQQRDQPRILTPLGNGALMRRHGIDGAIELDWWEGRAEARPTSGDRQDADYRPMWDGLQAVGRGEVQTITLVPARHFSARAISDRNRNLWGGFVIRGSAGNAYFAGDTGWGRHFAEIGERFAPIRAAMLPIGAFLPRWFMQPAHIDPAQAVRAHRELRARTSIAMHFGTFALGDDGMDDPVRELESVMAANGDLNFRVLDHGEGRDLP